MCSISRADTVEHKKPHVEAILADHTFPVHGSTPTVVGASESVPFWTILRVDHAVFCVGRTQWVVLSAPHAENRVINA